MRKWFAATIALLLVNCGVYALAVSGLLCGRPELKTYTLQASGIMGTEVELVAVAPADQEDLARRSLIAAERELKRIDAAMSNYISSSEVSRLNDAPVGKEVKVSGELLSLLKIARIYTEQTTGSFDATCGPLMELWKQASRQNQMPAADEIAAARLDTGWRNFELRPDGAVKLRAGARIDLGGVAKKYAIDLAVDAMRRTGAAGGMVNVGGDVRCFGRDVKSDRWRIAVRFPFQDQDDTPLAIVEMGHESICTSGNYERFDVIEGRRFSHIKDPRTGMPADNYPSVTVIGKDAASAGTWATALSILGPEGLKIMPKGLEAMIVVGDRDHYTLAQSAGFSKYIVSGPRKGLAGATMPAQERAGFDAPPAN